MNDLSYELETHGNNATYTLHEAECGGHAVFVTAQGDGTTIGLRLTIQNLRDYPICILVQPETYFIPDNSNYQEMAILRSASVRLKALETRTVWVNTVCLQANRNAPQSAFTVAARFLKGEGLGNGDIAEIIEEEGDDLAVHLDDLERIGRRLGYTPAKAREIAANLESLSSNGLWTDYMGYRLSPLPTRNADEIHAVTQAVESLDANIVKISQLVEQQASNLIQKYGRKRVIEELANRGINLAAQYAAQLDLSLARNVFANCGHDFRAGEAYKLLEFDLHNDPEGRSTPRLNSVAVQYAVWSLTDSFGIEECCERIKSTGRKAELFAAGARCVLRQAERVREGGIHPSRRIGLFARSPFRRKLARRFGF
jgi:hypothetical protein